MFTIRVDAISCMFIDTLRLRYRGCCFNRYAALASPSLLRQSRRAALASIRCAVASPLLLRVNRDADAQQQRRRKRRSVAYRRRNHNVRRRKCSVSIDATTMVTQAQCIDEHDCINIKSCEHTKRLHQPCSDIRMPPLALLLQCFASVNL